MSLPKPYYTDDACTIYHGDCRDILPALDSADAIVTDPPYSETSLKWDVWPAGWVGLCSKLVNSLWCFGSLRMFVLRHTDFEDWKMSQDIVWEKHNGSNSLNDRFRRVHELAVHFYQGDWDRVYKNPIYTNDASKRTVRRKCKPAHWGDIGASSYQSEDGGPRLERSVIYSRSCHGHALHPTEKPAGILRPLILYSVPLKGIVLDPFMGSGSTLRVAKDISRRAIGIEINEQDCEISARRLEQEVLAL